MGKILAAGRAPPKVLRRIPSRISKLLLSKQIIGCGEDCIILHTYQKQQLLRAWYGVLQICSEGRETHELSFGNMEWEAFARLGRSCEGSHKRWETGLVKDSPHVS